VKTKKMPAPRWAGTGSVRAREGRRVLARLERMQDEDPARFVETMKFLEELLEEQRAESGQ
jgi:hypothetical protein